MPTALLFGDYLFALLSPMLEMRQCDALPVVRINRSQNGIQTVCRSRRPFGNVLEAQLVQHDAGSQTGDDGFNEASIN